MILNLNDEGNSVNIHIESSHQNDKASVFINGQEIPNIVELTQEIGTGWVNRNDWGEGRFMHGYSREINKKQYNGIKFYKED